MKKCILLAGVLLAVIAVGASAAELKIFNTLPGSQWLYNNTTQGYNVSALSDDGTTIFAQVGNKATAITVATGANLFQLAANTHSRGFAKWDGNGGSFTWITSMGFETTGANPVKAGWTRQTGSLGAGNRLRNSAGTIGVTTPAVTNGASIDFDSGDGWMVGHGMGASLGKGVAWRVAVGNMSSTTAVWEQAMGTSVSNGGLNDVSNAGIAVGVHNDPFGSPADMGAVLADLNSNTAGSMTDIVAYPGADANSGAATGISANAALGATPTGYAGGFFKTSGWRNAFRLDLALGTGTAATQLLPIDGSYAGNDEAEVFDVSNNGIAVGYDLAGGVRTAAVWLPGATTAISLESLMNETMPANITDLLYAVSITPVPNIDGAYTIAGQAITDAGLKQAFVATILPEPATLGFLALGGLFLSRRRR